MAPTSKKMVLLKSSDGEMFEVDELAALQSQTIKHIIEDDCTDTTIPLPNVTSHILSKVIEYCKRHVIDANTARKAEKEASESFDTQFIKVEQAILFELMLAANYLDIKSLLDLTCQAVADNINDKTTEQVRTIFNIVNDFTPEEEEKIRSENGWAFD